MQWYYPPKVKHPTECVVFLGDDDLDISVRMSRERLEFLQKVDPMLYFGDIRGKHSDVHYRFRELYMDMHDDYAEVEEHCKSQFDVVADFFSNHSDFDPDGYMGDLGDA